MCIVFFEWRDDRFLVCHNRDEFFSRPTTKTDWWTRDEEDGFEILAPRDVVSGGTWFGFEKTTGRCAFLTNIRELDSTKYSSSRGEFVVNYLKSDKNLSALEYLCQEFGPDGELGAKNYAGFNLVVFSGRDMAYFSNRYPEDQAQTGPIALSIGTSYGLSNSILQEPYAKVLKGLQLFDQIVNRPAESNSSSEEDSDSDSFHRLMKDLENMMLRKEYCPGDSLPRTGEPGFSEEIVKRRSSICVPEVEGYGTRTTIRFLLERNRRQEGDERSTAANAIAQKEPWRLRCIEKNWNIEVAQWEKSVDLDCVIPLR